MNRDRYLAVSLLLSVLLHALVLGIASLTISPKKEDKERYIEIIPLEEKKPPALLPFIPKGVKEVPEPPKDAKMLGPKDLKAPEEKLPKSGISQQRQPAVIIPKPQMPKPFEPPAQAKTEKKSTDKASEKKQTEKKTAEKEEQKVLATDKQTALSEGAWKVNELSKAKKEAVEQKPKKEETTPQEKPLPTKDSLIPKTQDLVSKMPKEESLDMNSGRVKGSKELLISAREFRYWSYLDKMKRKIELLWEYPEFAAKRGITGSLKLDFDIGKDGKLAGDIRLVEPSGYKPFDDAAIKAVKDSAPFPPFPPTWDISVLHIHGTFIYHLSVVQ